MEQGKHIVDRQSALEYLYGRIDYERTGAIPYRSRLFKLDRMQELLARLGNPHHGVDVVHIAGTKGKGSTAAMVASVLISAGYRTGLYTSPHLDRLEERFCVEGRACSEQELVQLVAYVQPVVEEMDRESAGSSNTDTGPTYFEITTAMAMLHFCRREVQIAVLEVGLGGRLDSTNVCWPLISVITSISFDHTGQLGSTLPEIAKEKAGIIKPGVPVVSGVRNGEARRVIENTARQWGSQLYELGRDFDFIYELATHASLGNVQPPTVRMVYRELAHNVRIGNLTLSLLGRHQAANAAVAVATLRQLHQLGWEIEEIAVRQGLANVVWPARIEVLGCQPIVVIDAAHNVASVDALIEAMQEMFPSQRRWLMFATSCDKDVNGMLSRLLPQFEGVVFTRFANNPRSIEPEQLVAQAREISGLVRRSIDIDKIFVRPDAQSAWRKAIELAQPEDLICVTGSFFIAAEMRPQALTLLEQCQRV